MISPPLQVVAAAIFNHQGSVLICKKPSLVDSFGRWEFPGGKVEPEDGPEPAEARIVALRREIREELSLHIRVEPQFFAVSRGVVDGRDIELFGFKANIESGKMKLNEHVSAKWLSVENIEISDLGVLDQYLLRELAQSL